MNNWDAIGRVTKDIKCQYTQSQKAFARFILAVDKYKKENGANFIPCVIWGKEAQTMEKLVKKGEKIAVNGSLESGSYTTKDGETRYTLEIKVSHFEFLIPKRLKDAIEEEHAHKDVDNSMESTNEHQQDKQVEHQEQMPDGWEYVDEDVPF